MRIRILQYVALIVLAVLPLACDSPTESDPPSGEYTLVSVNRDPLPFTFPGEGGITVVAGTLVVAADSATFFSSYEYGDSQWEVTERWEIVDESGNELELLGQGGGLAMLRASGGAAILDQADVEYRFER
jgi:hypothetical protein